MTVVGHRTKGFFLTENEVFRNFSFDGEFSIYLQLAALKSKKEKSGTLVLSLVLDLHIPHLCLAIHLDRPITSVSRLSEIRMSTVVSLETLKFKAVMNKQRMNATELLLYLWLVLSVDNICSVCFRGKLRH